jgi:hypothetical protein
MAVENQEGSADAEGSASEMAEGSTGANAAMAEGDGSATAETIDIEESVAATGDKRTKRHRHRPKKTTRVETAKGSGSAAAETGAKPPKVEWNPTMLLPTDKGSGTKQ